MKNTPRANRELNADEQEVREEILMTTPVKDRSHTLPMIVDVKNFFFIWRGSIPLAVSPMSQVLIKRESNVTILFGKERRFWKFEKISLKFKTKK
jgi:hypothetical protein